MLLEHLVSGRVRSLAGRILEHWLLQANEADWLNYPIVFYWRRSLYEVLRERGEL